MDARLPEALHRLFWDVDPTTVDVGTQRNFVLDRILEYGGIEAVRWAEATFGTGGLREYFMARGCRVLSAKTRAFWQAILALDETPCTPKSSTPTSNPLWPY